MSVTSWPALVNIPPTTDPMAPAPMIPIRMLVSPRGGILPPGAAFVRAGTPARVSRRRSELRGHAIAVDENPTTPSSARSRTPYGIWLSQTQLWWRLDSPGLRHALTLLRLHLELCLLAEVDEVRRRRVIWRQGLQVGEQGFYSRQLDPAEECEGRLFRNSLGRVERHESLHGERDAASGHLRGQAPERGPSSVHAAA